MVLSIHCVLTWADDKEFKSGMLALGAFDFTPLLNIEESYNDNIFHYNQNRKSSMVTQVTGGGELVLRQSLNRYALKYSFLSSQYHESSTDDFVDNTLGFNAHVEANSRNRFDLQTNGTFNHFMRGTMLSQGIIGAQLASPDQYHQYNAFLDYRYGGKDAKGNLDLQLGWTSFNYINHLERTAIQNRLQFDVTPGFYFRLMPKVYMTTQVQNTFIDYPDRLSSSETSSYDIKVNPASYNLRRYLFGLNWSQSSKTQGTIRVGYFQQQYNSINLQSASGLTWDGQLQWDPLAYSSFILGLTKGVQPSIGNGTARQVQVTNLTWRHNWPNKITTALSGYLQQTINLGVNTSTASGTSYSFDVKYEVRPWLNIGLNYLNSGFQSETNSLASNQQIYMLYIHAK